VQKKQNFIAVYISAVVIPLQHHFKSQSHCSWLPFCIHAFRPVFGQTTQFVCGQYCCLLVNILVFWQEESLNP